MKRYILFLIVALFGSVSCEKEYDVVIEEPTKHYLMTLKNESSSKTVWVIPEHGQKGCEVAGEFPDDLNSGVKVEIIRMDPESSISINIINNGVASVFETYHIQDKLQIYVFDAQVYDNNEWTQLKAGQMWTHQFSLSVQEVINRGYEVVYRK